MSPSHHQELNRTDENKYSPDTQKLVTQIRLSSGYLCNAMHRHLVNKTKTVISSHSP